MSTFRNRTFLMLALGSMGVVVAIFARRSTPTPAATEARQALPSPLVVREVHRPVMPDPVPDEVQEFLDRVLEKIPYGGEGVASYQLHHWKWKDKPTHEAIGIKPVPDLEPEKLISRVMDVDGYLGNIAHVESCRSIQDSVRDSPDRVRFVQVVSVPGVAKVQQVLMLVDAGMMKGYRVAYWRLLEDETEELDPKDGARSAFNVGAWLAAPGVVGYALSTWPRRSDVNLAQWRSLTTVADLLAKKVIDRNIDGMADWARKRRE